MKATPFSTRVITDIYQIGTNILEIAKKTHICFLTSPQEFDDFIKLNKEKQASLKSAYEKLSSLAIDDKQNHTKEFFTSQEKLIWAFATQNYVSNMKNVFDFYEGETLSVDFYRNAISACEEAVLIEIKIDALSEKNV
jgi:hypothetical protein